MSLGVDGELGVQMWARSVQRLRLRPHRSEVAPAREEVVVWVKLNFFFDDPNRKSLLR